MEVEEKIEIVQNYIYEKTGKQITINLMEGLNPFSLFFEAQYYKQVEKLCKAYLIAKIYYENKSV